MDIVSINFLKKYSSVIHMLLASVVVTGLLYLTVHESVQSIIYLLVPLSVFWAGFWGWKLSGWYLPMPGEKMLIEPYVATLVVTLLTAICSWGTFLFIKEIGPWDVGKKEIGSALAGGVFFGIYGFILSLPITVPISVILGKFLFVFVKKAHFNENVLTRQST